jgi:hypothetical protein
MKGEHNTWEENDEKNKRIILEKIYIYVCGFVELSFIPGDPYIFKELHINLRSRGFT